MAIARSLFRSGIVALACLLAFAALPARAAGYQFEAVQLPGAFVTSLSAINAQGVAVGYATVNFDTGAAVGLIATRGSVSTYTGPADAVSVDLDGISRSGVLFGNYANTLVDDGTGTLVPGPSQIFSFDPGNGSFRTYAIPGAPGAFVVGASPSGRWLVGTFNDDAGAIRGFVFDVLAGSATTLAHDGALTVVAAGVNDAGQVVGYDRVRAPGGGQTGVAWIYDTGSAAYTTLTIPAAGPRFSARAIDSSGRISGYFGDVRFRNVHGYTGLGGDGFQTLDAPGAAITSVFGANDDAVLVGAFQANPSASAIAFIARPVPEPAAWITLLAGLAGLGGRRRSARSRRQGPG